MGRIIPYSFSKIRQEIEPQVSSSDREIDLSFTVQDAVSREDAESPKEDSPTRSERGEPDDEEEEEEEQAEKRQNNSLDSSLSTLDLLDTMLGHFTRGWKCDHAEIKAVIEPNAIAMEPFDNSEDGSGDQIAEVINSTRLKCADDEAAAAESFCDEIFNELEKTVTFPRNCEKARAVYVLTKSGSAQTLAEVEVDRRESDIDLSHNFAVSDLAENKNETSPPR